MLPRTSPQPTNSRKTHARSLRSSEARVSLGCCWGDKSAPPWRKQRSVRVVPWDRIVTKAALTRLGGPAKLGRGNYRQVWREYGVHEVSARREVLAEELVQHRPRSTVRARAAPQPGN